MKNILETKQNVINAINIGSILENHKPTSINGQECVKNIIENFSNYSNSVGGVLYMRGRLNQYAHVDKALYEMVTKIDEKLNENSFDVKLVYCHENLSTIKNTLATSTCKVLEKLASVDINEAKNQIRNGALNVGVGSFSVLSTIIEEAKLKLDDHQEIGEEFNVRTPITYVEESNGSVYMRLGNKVYSILPTSDVVESNSPSPKFSYISSVLENLVTYDNSDKTFVYKNENLKVKIGEHNIKRFLDNKQVGVYENSVEFAKNMSFINESKNISTSQKSQLNEITDALISIKENFSDISQADNFLIIENKRTNEKFAIGNVENKFHVIVLESLRVPNVMETFSTATQAVTDIYKKSKYDARGFFAENLMLEEKQDQQAVKKYNTQKEIVEGIEEKIKRVDKYINEAHAEGNTRQVEALQKNKVDFQALLFEQKSILGEMSKDFVFVR